MAESSEKNRAVIESKKTDIIFNLENQPRQDFLHHRNSGLNHILAKLASENNTAIGFSFSNILAEKKRRARLFGRLMQNIQLCKKFGTKMVLASFASKPYQMRAAHDLEAFAKTISMTPKEAKQSLNNALDIVKLNIKKKSKSYLADGVELVE